MSGLLYYNWHFMNLLLNTETKQQKILLQNLTASQVDLITEIFFNLGHVVDLNPEQEKFMKRHLKVIRELSKVNRSRKYRNTSIRKNASLILKILNLVAANIMKAGESF